MIANVIKSQIEKKSLHITHVKIQQFFSIWMKDTTLVFNNQVVVHLKKVIYILYSKVNAFQLLNTYSKIWGIKVWTNFPFMTQKMYTNLE
jgi:hypothetical protein